MDFSLFDKRQLTTNDLYLNIGRTPERPFVITAAFTETSLGDLLSSTLFVATLKNQFDHARLYIRYRDVRPYSREVMSLVPGIDRADGIKGHVPVWARFGIPDMRLWNPWARSIDSKTALYRSFCDFFATDWMANWRMLHKFPNLAQLKVPEAEEPLLKRKLEELGVDPNRWFVTVHYRTSNYLNKRSGKLRNADPDAVRRLVDYIIDELGGQVVQLGHPEMEPFPPRKGLIDLSRIKNSFMLQATAVCYSRYLVAGPSGPVTLGWGFQVPTASVDSTDAHGSWGPALATILSHEVTTPDGQVLRNQDLYDAGLLEYAVLRDKIRAGEDYRVRKNSSEELIAVANHYHQHTLDVTGWRKPSVPKRVKPSNGFVWPPNVQDVPQTFLDV